MFRPRTPHGRGAPRSAVLILALAISSTRVLAQRQTGTTEAERRVESLVAQMTLQEKITLIAGVNGFVVPAIPRLGIPELGMADSPFGVRALGPSTLYAGGINLAATWNPELAERVGTEVGRDARARGKHYSLGPGLNIYRSPLNGR